jgi:hypothetical protein
MKWLLFYYQIDLAKSGKILKDIFPFLESKLIKKAHPAMSLFCYNKQFN